MTMKKMNEKDVSKATGGASATGMTRVNPNTSAGLCPDFLAKGELSEPGYPRCRDCVHCVAEETADVIVEGVQGTKIDYWCEKGL